MIRRVAPFPLAMFSCVREEHDSDLKYRTNKQNEFTLGTANTGGGEALRSTLVVHCIAILVLVQLYWSWYWCYCEHAGVCAVSGFVGTPALRFTLYQLASFSIGHSKLPLWLQLYVAMSL